MFILLELFSALLPFLVQSAPILPEKPVADIVQEYRPIELSVEFSDRPGTGRLHRN